MALTRRQFVVAAALACIGCAEQQSNKTAATGANMQTGMSSKQALFKSIDKNGDGKLHPAEVMPDEVANQAAIIVSRLDTNRDGRVSAAEGAGAEAGRLLKHADRNHDGGITVEELADELRFRRERSRQLERASRAAGLRPGLAK